MKCGRYPGAGWNGGRRGGLRACQEEICGPTIMGLPRQLILRRRSAFQKVREEGRARPGRGLLVTVLKVEPSEAGFGFVTPKYVGKAHDRNLLRRRLREIVRRRLAEIAPGWQVVTLARRGIAAMDFAELEAEWVRLARKSGILAREGPLDGRAKPQANREE